MVIVPQKTDSSKIYIIKLICHRVTDALSYLHLTSMLQDQAWQDNPVPRPVIERLPTWKVFFKSFELMKILDSWKKKQDATEKVVIGEPSGKYSYNVSGPIDLELLKYHSKELNVTINEMFVGAVLAAYSKLELPEERMPAQVRAFVAVSTAR